MKRFPEVVRSGPRLAFALSAALALAACLAAPVAAQQHVLRAGAARVDITPTPDEFPFPARNLPPFVSVHDPVFARALMLEDGATEVAFVIVDVTQIPVPERFSKSVADALGIPENHLMLAASHTHSVPLVNFHGSEPDALQSKEIERVMQGAVSAAQQAKAKLQPARISFGRGEAWVNIHNGQGTPLLEQGDPHGPSDKSLDVIRVEAADGKPLAMLVDYGVPSTVMLDSVNGNGGWAVTGDLVGVAAQYIEKKLAGTPVVLFASGPDGDQRPVYRAIQIAGHLEAADEGAAAWGLLDAQARSLANATLATVGAMTEGTSDVTLSAAATTVACPGQERVVNQKTGSATMEDRPPVQIPLSLIRLNDIAVAGVGGNVAAEIGQRFKAASPIAHTTMVTVTSGSVGYLLTDEEYRRGGHNAGGASVKTGCAEKAIVQGLLDLAGAKP